MLQSQKKFTPKDLKIKTGVVKRIAKELGAYLQEEQKQQERIQKLRDQQADEADIKKQIEVLQETIDILPDCKQRLQKSTRV
ncbi:tubulin binding cofactor A [Gorgonomyces haynaldii]|nr:tubulin binding cofactor A [Gorgonomyces haynaldii]